MRELLSGIFLKGGVLFFCLRRGLFVCLRRGLFVNSDKKYAKTSFETDGFKASFTFKSLACYGT